VAEYCAEIEKVYTPTDMTGHDEALVVWFWQRTVSPHMAWLSEQLAIRGVSVTYVANKLIEPERINLGWNPPNIKHAKLEIVKNKFEICEILKNVSENSIHICQGMHRNGLVRAAQRILASRKLKQWVIMETVSDRGFLGPLRRLLYKLILCFFHKKLEGVLAIGWQTSSWLVERGLPSHKAYPFAYFLNDDFSYIERPMRRLGRFRFIFVGRLISLKRVDLLMESLSELCEESFELIIVGDGPLYESLRLLGSSWLPDQIIWRGKKPITLIPQEIMDADCLVLPSNHDGWGAVVSEALMLGTPVICSDACGSAGIVQKSGYGGIFRSGDKDELTSYLRTMLDRGPMNDEETKKLRTWARSLGAENGAYHLEQILKSRHPQTTTTELSVQTYVN
jgi:glycosyltransferase involved in cell wall biosynthesis